MKKLLLKSHAYFFVAMVKWCWWLYSKEEKNAHEMRHSKAKSKKNVIKHSKYSFKQREKEKAVSYKVIKICFVLVTIGMCLKTKRG